MFHKFSFSFYLPAVLYVIGLYLFLLLVLGSLLYKIIKKEDVTRCLLLAILAIAVDLFLFHHSIYDLVTSERDNIRFSEYPTEYDFSDTKPLNLISEDVFCNFRPTLYKKPVALSSYTTHESFRSSKITETYIMLLSSSSTDPLHDKLNKFNTRQFIEYGFLNIDNFSDIERLFFSKILLAVTEGFLYSKSYYEKYFPIDRMTEDLTNGIVENVAFYKDPAIVMSSREQIEKNINLLFSLVEERSFSQKNMGYMLSSTGEEGFAVDPEFLSFLYNDISAKEYLLFLYEKIWPVEHTFVLLKDYYDLINIDDVYKKYRWHHNFLSKNLSDALGVTKPVIQYYKSAKFSTKEDTLSAFKYTNKTVEDTLYLQQHVDNSDKSSVSEKESSFSYEVLNYNPNALTVTYDSSEDGFLYYSDCYDTYWNAYIDGEDTDIYKANVAFKAIKIPGGKHKVDFIYDPKLFRISLRLYYICFSVVLVYLVIGILRGKARGCNAD
jgi:membrane protein YfhO